MREIVGVLAVLACVMSGCGGDDDGAGSPDAGDRSTDAAAVACGAEATSVNGTVADQMIDPVASTWSRTHPTFAYATLIVLEEDGTSTCAQSTGTGSGERLSLIFCDPPTTGEYEIVTPEAFPEDACPGDMVASAIVEDETASDLDTAASGTITVDAADACRAGTFSISFTTGTLTGDFAAPTCD